MKTASLCFSVLHIPRRRFVTLANICLETFSGSKTCKTIHTSRHIDYRVYGIGGHDKRWTRRPITTNIESKESILGGKPSISPGISEEIVASTKLNVNRVEGKGVQEIQYSDIQVKIAENKDLARLVTFIVMDIETSSLDRKAGRIIEIAFQDLKGGHNSTFQTLVNPQRRITNADIHGITTSMVNRPDVPRMEELIPVLLQYISSRQQPGGYVVLVAHNGRVFDVPFLISEFSRCSYEIPSNWLFLDTIPLAREVRKSAAGISLICCMPPFDSLSSFCFFRTQPLDFLAGTKGRVSVSLEALREHYGVPLVGTAHRAMSDVHSLALIFQRITFDLKLPVSELMQKCFRASDVGSASKKKTTKKNPS